MTRYRETRRHLGGQADRSAPESRVLPLQRPEDGHSGDGTQVAQQRRDLREALRAL